MREMDSFDYAVIRVVPCIDREEFVNAGVVLRCIGHEYLGCRIHVDERRIKTLWPAADIDVVRGHLEAFPRICAGDAAAGPIAKLSLNERFHWLVAPRSTVIQVSPVHTGLTASPEQTLEELHKKLVLI